MPPARPRERAGLYTPWALPALRIGVQGREWDFIWRPLAFAVVRVATLAWAAWISLTLPTMTPINVQGTGLGYLPPLWDAFAGVWAHWDGSWYLRIAEHGYWYWDYSEAFFPLYPLAMALLSSLVSIAPFMAGIIISNVSTRWR